MGAQGNMISGTEGQIQIALGFGVPPDTRLLHLTILPVQYGSYTTDIIHCTVRKRMEIVCMSNLIRDGKRI